MENSKMKSQLGKSTVKIASQTTSSSGGSGGPVVIPTIDETRLGTKTSLGKDPNYEKVKPKYEKVKVKKGPLDSREFQRDGGKLTVIFGSFAVLYLVSGALGALGIYFAYRPALQRRSIGSMCRLSKAMDYQTSYRTSCIFEQGREQCSGDVCAQIIWDIDSNEPSYGRSRDEDEFHAWFIRKIENVTIADVEKGQCKENHWCKNGKCQLADESGARGSFWTKFLYEDEEIWEKAKNPPCLDISSGGRAAMSRIRQHENCPAKQDACKGMDNTASIQIRAELQRCVSEDDRRTGKRRKPCTGVPMKIYKCQSCGTYQKDSEVAFRKQFCPGDDGKCYLICGKHEKKMDDGTPCTLRQGGNGICFLGECYPLSK